MVFTLLNLAQSPAHLTTLGTGSFFYQAIERPDLSAYMTTHSPHNALALNDASFSSTMPTPSFSTHTSLLGTNTVRP